MNLVNLSVRTNHLFYDLSILLLFRFLQEELERLSSVRNLVGQLYAALNVDEHQLRLEREMMAELERLQAELGNAN